MDNSRFTEAQAMLHPDCVYKMRTKTYRGPEAIIKTYEDNYQAGIKKLDEIVYSSTVVPISPSRFRLKYADKIRKGEAWHEYKCEQVIKLRDGLVLEIQHIDLPGQDEALQFFYKTNGVVNPS